MDDQVIECSQPNIEVRDVAYTEGGTPRDNGVTAIATTA